MGDSGGKPIRLGKDAIKRDKSISISKDEKKIENSDSKSSLHNKDNSHSTGLIKQFVSKSPIIVNRSFNPYDSNSGKDVKVEIISQKSSQETQLIKKSNLLLPNKEHSVKSLAKVEEAEITNYFMSSKSSKFFKETSNTSGSKPVVGKGEVEFDNLMKKINYFDESCDFSKSEDFVD